MLDVDWKKYQEERIFLILGKVRHSYAASKAPLLPWVLVHCDGMVLVAHCTCMAGLAETCSHVGVVLHWVETAVRVRNDTPCTSKENKWLMSTPVKGVPYLELRNFDFTTSKCQSIVLTSNSSNINAKTPTNNRGKLAFPSTYCEAIIFSQNCIRAEGKIHYSFRVSTLQK